MSTTSYGSRPTISATPSNAASAAPIVVWHQLGTLDGVYSVLRCLVPRRERFGALIPASREREQGTAFRKLLSRT